MSEVNLQVVSAKSICQVKFMNRVVYIYIFSRVCRIARARDLLRRASVYVSFIFSTLEETPVSRTIANS